jgi:hypothetical protein
VIRTSSLALAAWCCALPAAALLTRADRADAEYLELATSHDSCVRLATAGEGVLIAPRWVLTAASVARALQAMHPLPALMIGGQSHAIASVHAHPEHLGLVLLEEPVRDVAPAAIHRDEAGLGRGVVVAGHGPTGAMGGPARIAAGRRRAAINTVERVEEHAFELEIKAGDARSDLQGALTGEEIGAPAYVRAGEATSVAGILTATDGRRERFVRLSARARWIDETMLDVALREAAKVK